MSTRSMVEGALLTAFTVLLSFIGIYVPLLGIFASLFVAVPIIVLVTRQGLRVGIIASVASAVLVAIVAQPYQALVVLFAAGLVGLAIGGALEEGFSPAKTVVVGTVAATIAEVGLLAASFLISGVDPFKMDMKAMSETMDSVLSMYKKAGIKPEQLAITKQTFTQALKLIKLTLPGALVMGSVVSTILNYMMTRSVLSRIGQQIEALPPFRRWTFPRWVAGGLVVGIILAFINVPVSFKTEMRMVAANFVYIFGGLSLVQGFSVVASFGGRYKMSTIAWIAALLWFINPVLFLAVGGWFGLLDPFVDFRKIRNSTSPE